MNIARLLISNQGSRKSVLNRRVMAYTTEEHSSPIVYTAHSINQHKAVSRDSFELGCYITCLMVRQTEKRFFNVSQL